MRDPSTALALLTFLVCTVVSCESSDPSAEARFDTSEGFQNLVIPVASHGRTPSGSLSIVAVGALSGREIGVRLRVDPSTRPGIVDGQIDASSLAPDGVFLESLGPPTQGLVEVLAAAYEIPLPSGGLRKSIPLAAFALEGDPRRIEAEHVNFKVFHDEREERGQYYELFVHIDLPARRVEIREKDPDYRASVIRGFFE